jgi:Fe-S cluster biogenesis protein NfuA
MSNAAVVNQPVSIRAEISLADADTCRFITSCLLHPGGTFFFAHHTQAVGSPLGERLFALPGVANVLIAENVVTVNKEPDASWSGLKAAIGGAIRSQVQSGVPAILDTYVPTSLPGRPNQEVEALVQELLDQDINVSIASHGGKISIVNFDEGKLFIAMSGGCQGCASSQVTLRQGFEVMVKKIAPEVKEIIDTTDHAAGNQPFYPR